MLFPEALHDGIRDGSVTVAIRRWARPTVQAGGTLLTPAGLLTIDAVEPIALDDVTPEDARRAGARSVEELLADLREGEDRMLYRIRFHRASDDPRIALREQEELSGADVADIDAQLDRWDAASRTGPWTADLLRAIAQGPETPSRVLAERLEIDQSRLKRRVRQLKGLGLTESLGTGYRLAARGVAYRAATDRSRPSASQN
ncbi:hypothetical protein [Euzebya tangerina]|uniref:hypothetical protein n=1 Tax=Euzebya tangerina TaxID=591198 RepID=UPI000E31B1A2|nr:hypothetical protein [Euzebya tangerina]